MQSGEDLPSPEVYRAISNTVFVEAILDEDFARHVAQYEYDLAERRAKFIDDVLKDWPTERLMHHTEMERYMLDCFHEQYGYLNKRDVRYEINFIGGSAHYKEARDKEFALAWKNLVEGLSLTQQIHTGSSS